MTSVHFDVWDDRLGEIGGTGCPILFVHGSGPSWGTETFAQQREMAGKHRLILLDRRGFGASPPAEPRSDFEVDAQDIRELVSSEKKGVHLVGSSYGAVATLLAAGRNNSGVKSLTVIEPPALGLIRGDGSAEVFIRRLASNYAKAGTSTPQESWAGFLEAFGFPRPGPESLSNMTERELKGVKTSMTERPPWEADIPMQQLRRRGFPILAVSGGWRNAPELARSIAGAAFNKVCDVIESEVSAERVVFEKANHSAQVLGKEFNEKLQAFITRAEHSATLKPS